MSFTMPSALPDPDYDHAFYDGVPAKRLFAWMVDVVIVTFITFLLGLLTLSVLWWIWPLTFIATNFLYRAGTIAAGSATLGMRLMNLELRGATGAAVGRRGGASYAGLYGGDRFRHLAGDLHRDDGLWRAPPGVA
jgi:hypothetical protein